MPHKTTMLLWAVACWCYVEECVCFSNGSVALSCDSMIPAHKPYSPSTSNPPFKLFASSGTYRPGEVLSVTLQVVQSNSTEFQGFLLQARSRQGNGRMWHVGRFTNINTTLFTALDCNGMENSAVSQASGAKKKSVQLTWLAPSNSNYGDIYFSASVVQDYTMFWAGLNTSIVRLDTSGNSAAGVFSSPLLFISLLSLSV